MTAEREPRLRLFDILEASERILARAPEDKRAFEFDEALQIWVIYHVQVIGEAAANVPDAIRSAHPEVRWGALCGMRNRLIHGYFDIDLDVIWEVVMRDIPALREQIARILEEMQGEDTPR